MKEATGIKSYSNEREETIRDKFLKHFKNCPIPGDQILSNLGLFLNSKTLSRILFMDQVYKQIVDTQGVVIDFGTRWGQNMSVFAALRGIYEPFNRHRKIVGFDTFQGFPSVHEKDGSSDLMKAGNVSCTNDYAQYLEKVMELQEQDNPLNHIKKFDIAVGDAVVEIEKYLKKNPHTIVALAYFDFDIYEPTKKCLQAIKPHLVKGSVLGFDELNDHDSPGETLALQEVFGLNNIRLKRHRYTSRVSYFVVE
ncbi:MAG: crotonobetainyl-CoA--carnitine CoA-transferase [Candidatus Margulisiibacteriota bacterium]